MVLASFLVAVHVMANLVWIGSIVSVAWLVAAAAKTQDASAALLARSLYMRAAVPAFLVSFLAGSLRVALDFSNYMHLHWFHAKATTAIVVIALHHVIGARAKKVAGAAGAAGAAAGASGPGAPVGSMQAGKSGGILGGALLAFAFLTVVFVIFNRLIVP